jgi:hypothetical protein
MPVYEYTLNPVRNSLMMYNLTEAVSDRREWTTYTRAYMYGWTLADPFTIRIFQTFQNL